MWAKSYFPIYLLFGLQQHLAASGKIRSPPANPYHKDLMTQISKTDKNIISPGTF